MNFSLLYPETGSCDFYHIGSVTASDLGIPYLCDFLSETPKHRKILEETWMKLVSDPETIRYRQEIFSDILFGSMTSTVLYRVVELLENISYVEPARMSEEEQLWKHFQKFKELELFTSSYTEIAQELNKLDLKSEGLRKFRDLCNELTGNEEFIALSHIIQSLRISTDEVRSFTLGINLDTSLNPKSVALLSVNNVEFKENTFVNKINDVFDAKNHLAGILTPAKLHRVNADRRDTIEYTLYKDIERYLKPLMNSISSSLRKYRNTTTQFFLNLIPELQFYLGMKKLFDVLQKHQMPLCRPVILNMEKRDCMIEGIYNVKTALEMIVNQEEPCEKLVKNSLSLNDNGRVQIITGPNQGGKTVYTEAVGLAVVLIQSGFYAPGEWAEISPVDKLFSHFPVDETKTVGLGRLAEESVRIGNIFQEATAYSMILLNETLTSTSYMEGLHLAFEITKGFCYLGARVLYNTHMHELALKVPEINEETQGKSKAVSLVAGIKNGKRTFEIVEGSPDGNSYADDIARKYGLSFSQIRNQIDKAVQ